MSTENQSRGGRGLSGVMFVGCLMIGLAIGLLTGNVVVGIIGGLGVGFVAMAGMSYRAGQW